MPSRGSALAVAVASTTLSPWRTTAEPWACLANFPVSNESCLPPARSTVTLLTSGFMFHPLEQAASSWLLARGIRSRQIERGARLYFHRSRVEIGVVGCAEKMHVAEDPQCSAGFQTKAAFSDTLMGTISQGLLSQAY